MAELRFFTGVMDAGKSTLALQTHHNRTARGFVGRLYTTRDRSGTANITSRLGMQQEAIEVTEDFDFWGHLVESLTHGAQIDHLICDEAQFYSRAHIESLARIVDELDIDVFCFGITTDFRTNLFEGSARLLEVADSVETLQVEPLCWCGKRATHNARVEDGQMVTEGEVVVVGDTQRDADGSEPFRAVSYEVLCRAHHQRRMTAGDAGVVSRASAPLPLG